MQKSTSFRYSRTVIFLPLLLVTLFVWANAPTSTIVEATRNALGFALICHILLACLFLPDGYLTRPNKYLWKAVTGISFFYLAVLIYLLFLSKEQASQVIQGYFAPGLKLMNYEEASYAEDCRIFKPEHPSPFSNLFNSFFDFFALAHFIGWALKTIILRDLKLVLLSSVFFQIVEFSLRDVLNNFKECWWDHVIVDILGCNALGICLGFAIIRYFQMERYKWSMRIKPFKTSFWEMFKMFWTKWNLSKMEAKIFSSTKKYLQVVYFLIFVQMVDLSIFFLKYVHGIPPSHYICLIRSLIITLLATNATRQYYKFLMNEISTIRVNMFLVNLIVWTEFFIVFKHGKHDFDHAHIHPAGKYLLGGIGVLLVVLLIKIMISDCCVAWKRHTHKKEKQQIQGSEATSQQDTIKNRKQD